MAALLFSGILSSILPISLSVVCLQNGELGEQNGNPLSPYCEGQQCYVEENVNERGSNYYRDCVSGLSMLEGCVKYVFPDYTAIRCYCSNSRKDAACNGPEPFDIDPHPATVNTSSVICAREDKSYCSSYECLYVNRARQCHNSVYEFIGQESWFGYLWQNTCIHHKTQAGLIESACRCNTNYCNEHLGETAVVLATNTSLRTRPLIKCHISFEKGGIATDKYFCIGELCALSEAKGVRTCVNITNLGNAEPIKRLGLIDFENRTFYLCEREYCNWNGSVALASLSTTWKPSPNDTRLVPFDGSGANYHNLIVPIAIAMMLWSRN